MSNLVQGLVWNAEIPNAQAKVIAVKLADWADDDGGSIYPAVNTVAKMTSCGRSTVCKWQFAMEHCGLLKVLERSKGGTRDDTTERAFDLDLLKRLAWSKVDKRKVPPDLRLVVGTIERQTTDKDGNPKAVKVTVFELHPFAGEATLPPQDEQQEGDADNDPTVHRTDGTENTTRPPRGLEPSGNLQEEPLPPLPPGGGQDDAIAEQAPEEPSVANTPRPASKLRRPTRRPTKSELPKDWRLPDTWREWATAHAPGRAPWIDSESDKFRDHWQANAGCKADWQAAWRNWWRKACEAPAPRVRFAADAAPETEQDRLDRINMGPEGYARYQALKRERQAAAQREAA